MDSNLWSTVSPDALNYDSSMLRIILVKSTFTFLLIVTGTIMDVRINIKRVLR